MPLRTSADAVARASAPSPWREADESHFHPPSSSECSKSLIFSTNGPESPLGDMRLWWRLGKEHGPRSSGGTWKLRVPENLLRQTSTDSSDRGRLPANKRQYVDPRPPSPRSR